MTTDPEILNLFEEIVAKFELTARERALIDLRFGITGARLNLVETGRKLGELPGLKAVTRQRVFVLLEGLKNRLGPIWTKLEELFPEEVSETRVRRMYSAQRKKITSYLRIVREDDPLQYAEVHRLLDVELPAHRKASAAMLDDIQSCIAFMEDYGVRNFGRYRFCTYCQQVKPSLGEESQFYVMANARRGTPYIYQVCRACNTERCVDFARTRKKTAQQAAE